MFLTLPITATTHNTNRHIHMLRIDDANMGREFHVLPGTGRSSDEMEKYRDAAVTFADTVFGFWEDFQNPPDNSSNSGDSLDDDGDDDDHDEKVEDQSLCSLEKNKAFWEEQDHLLQATLRRTSSIETRIRQATKEALRELNASEMECICRRAAVANSCRDCLRREICNRLLNLGYNCAIPKSKWTSSPEIPAGEHTYLEVVDKSNTKRGEVKVVIELNFRAEFEMARANQEYNRLISRLPEVFVGKAERLRVLIKIMCSASKKCMKEKNMHLGPWRKHKYMQAKWFGKNNNNNSNELTWPLPLPTTKVYSAPRPHNKPKASMLTYDLLENIPSMHCAAVEVV